MPNESKEQTRYAVGEASHACIVSSTALHDTLIPSKSLVPVLPSPYPACGGQLRSQLCDVFALIAAAAVRSPPRPAPQMDHYSSSLDEDKMARVKADMDDVKNVMVDNIEKVPPQPPALPAPAPPPG